VPRAAPGVRELRSAADVSVGRALHVTAIALATCAAFPQGDPDDAHLVAALQEATWAVWDDPGVDWAAFDLVVVRSTWDYQQRRDAFLAWARSLPRVVNPVAVLEWNTDKRYLAELPGAVSTTFLSPGEPFAAPRGQYVVKPTVSAGSRDTARFGAGEDERAGALVGAIHAGGRTAMVQPYVNAVDVRGETALMFFDGRFSHAIRKGPLLRLGEEPHTEVFAAEDVVACDPDPAERALAEQVLEHVRTRWGRDLAYARVDLVPGAAGPQLLELELTEPSLFFGHAPGAAERLAAALGVQEP
jgi:glutathione synthase/RimK-type ligase-like ATP-grasp enzyme